MNDWKWTHLPLGIGGFALATILCMALMQTAETSGASDNPHSNPAFKLISKRVFKFKTSHPDGMKIAAQTEFQPGERAKMKFSIESEGQTKSVEFTVKSLMGEGGTAHSIEANFLEQHGKAKPEIVRRPKIRTLESTPATLQIGDFYFEILIEPVKL